jgi:hypothetical protein
MVIRPDGPDRDVYRIAVGSRLAFAFENRTDVSWIVSLEGFDVPSEACVTVTAGSVEPAALRPGTDPGIAPPAVPADQCVVPPHATVAIDRPAFAIGPQVVRVGPSEGFVAGTGYPVIFDLEVVADAGS